MVKNKKIGGDVFENNSPTPPRINIEGSSPKHSEQPPPRINENVGIPNEKSNNGIPGNKSPGNGSNGNDSTTGSSAEESFLIFGVNGYIILGIGVVIIAIIAGAIYYFNKDSDKSVFGVISKVENTLYRTDEYGSLVSNFEGETGDIRTFINSLGEGAIWVSNKNPINLESGDYITTSSIPGYGMKQSDDVLHNYTVAKITMDCNFNPQTQPVKEILKDSEGNNILDANGFIQWVDSSTLTEQKYDLRYLLPDGTQIPQSEYDTRLANNETVYKAAFVGCTYHCG